VTLWIRDNLIYTARRRVAKFQHHPTLRSDSHFVADEKSHEKWEMNRKRSWVRGRFDASNLIYRRRRHRPVIEEGETSRIAGSRSLRMHRALERRPRHVRRSYFLTKSQSRQRRYCHVRVMNPDGETERSVEQYTIPSWRYRMPAVCNRMQYRCRYTYSSRSARLTSIKVRLWKNTRHISDKFHVILVNLRA